MSSGRGGFRAAILRAWRLAALGLVAWIVFDDAEQRRSAARGAGPGLREVQVLLPDVARIDAVEGSASGDAAGVAYELTGHDEEALGELISTSPFADGVTGYGGPSEVWLVLSADGTVATAVLRRSADTEEHVRDVRDAAEFWAQLVGRPAAELRGGTLDSLGIDGVSGATRTSAAIVESIGARLGARAGDSGAVTMLRLSWRDAPLLGLTAAGVWLALRGRATTRARKRVRRVVQVLCVVWLGLVSADLLAWSLFGAWLQFGVPWRSSPGLAALAAVALFVPLLTGRSVYCAHVCPHGAVQEWLGRPLRRSRLRRLLRPPAVLRDGLEALPFALFGTVVVALLLGLRLDLASLEAFDGWLLGAAAAVSLWLLIGGFAASVAVPMAYCRYGCPTGALLKSVRTTAGEGFGRKDVWLALLLVVAVLCSTWREPLRQLLADAVR